MKLQALLFHTLVLVTTQAQMIKQVWDATKCFLACISNTWFQHNSYMLGDPVWKISIGVYYRRKDGGSPWYSRTGEQWQVTEDWWEAQGDMAVPQVLPVHMAWDGNQGHGSQFLDWFSLLCRTLRCRKSLFQRAIHCFTPFCLQFLSKYGREIPCYEPTVYTENDGVGSYTTQDWIESWMISQNGYNRPNLTELEAQCQELGCDPFCSRCFNQKTTLRVSLLIHCLQSGWRLYNVYSDKQWRRSNSGPWVEVLRAGFTKILFSKWQKLV